MELCKYELTENEWKIASQLQDVLKVCHIPTFSQSILLGTECSLSRFSRM